MIEEASLPVESEDDELVEKIINRVQTSSRNSRRELAIDLHMQTGTKRTLLNSILDQLLRDEVLIEKEVKKERGPATVRLFSRAN